MNLWLELGSYCFSPISDVGLVENVAEKNTVYTGKETVCQIQDVTNRKRVSMFIIFIPL